MSEASRRGIRNPKGAELGGDNFWRASVGTWLWRDGIGELMLLHFDFHAVSHHEWNWWVEGRSSLHLWSRQDLVAAYGNVFGTNQGARC